MMMPFSNSARRKSICTPEVDFFRQITKCNSRFIHFKIFLIRKHYVIMIVREALSCRAMIMGCPFLIRKLRSSEVDLRTNFIMSNRKEQF